MKIVPPSTKCRPQVYEIPLYRVSLVRQGTQTALSLFSGNKDITVDIFRDYIGDSDREVLAVMLLNTDQEIIGLHTAHVGTLDRCLISPRDILKVALLANADSLILAHIHPMGSCSPSAEDQAMTENMKEACQIMGFTLLDHIVLGEGDSHYSFSENNDSDEED